MSDSLKPDKIVTIPNILSFIRILLVPAFAYCYFAEFKYHFYYTAGVLILSGITDIADGIVARKCNMITDFGKIIDPLADKLTQATAVICLAIRHPMLVALLILFFAKEFSMLLGAYRLLKMGLRPSESKWWGKLGTVVAFLLFICVLATDILPGTPYLDELVIVFAVLTAICLLFSLFNYYPIFKDIQSGEYDIEKEQSNNNDN